MADIIDPQVVKFCNEVLRPLCDSAVGNKALLDAQNVNYLTAILPVLNAANSGDIIIDGSQEDGRPILTAGDVKAAVVVFGLVGALYEEGTNEAKISLPHVNIRLPR